MTRKELQARFRADPDLKNRALTHVSASVHYVLALWDTLALIEDLLDESGTVWSDVVTEGVIDCAASLDTSNEMTDELAFDILLDACEHDTGERMEVTE